MKILNPKILEDLNKGRTIKLELGSGGKERKGFYALDHLELTGVDIVADLNAPLSSLPDNCVEYLYSRHTLEHVQHLLPLMSEIHRLTKPNGTIEIIVPHFSNVYGYSDPTHVRFFGLYSMYYFVARENQPKTRTVPPFYTKVRFKVNSLKIEFYKSGIIDTILSRLFTKIVNLNFSCQDFYERRLSSLFHAAQIRYLIQPEKQVEPPSTAHE